MWCKLYMIRVKIVQFHYCILNHHSQWIQISENMPSIDYVSHFWNRRWNLNNNSLHGKNNDAEIKIFVIYFCGLPEIHLCPILSSRCQHEYVRTFSPPAGELNDPLELPLPNPDLWPAKVDDLVAGDPGAVRYGMSGDSPPLREGDDAVKSWGLLSFAPLGEVPSLFLNIRLQEGPRLNRPASPCYGNTKITWNITYQIVMMDWHIFRII